MNALSKLLKYNVLIIFIMFSSGVTAAPLVAAPFVVSSPMMCGPQLDCTPGNHFYSLTDADTCGCCSCHGGSLGCAGGGNGVIVCQDGTYASDCRCQFFVNQSDFHNYPEQQF